MNTLLPDIALRGLLIAAGGLAAARVLSAAFRPSVTAWAMVLLLLPPLAVMLPRVELSAAWLPAGAGEIAAHSAVPWLAVWAAGALFCLLRIGGSALALRGLARNGRRVNEGVLLGALHQARDAAGLRKTPSLILLPGVAMPAAAGVFSPVVFLPEASADWPRERLEMVLRHECAHLARRDPAVQLLALLACAVHWFNPLAWRLRRAWLEQRELACDRLVLASGAAPAVYASALLETAVHFRAVGSPLLAGAVSEAGLEKRVRGILGRSERRPTRAAVLLVVVCGLAGAGAVAALTFRPAPSEQLKTEAAVRLTADAFPAD